MSQIIKNFFYLIVTLIFALFIFYPNFFVQAVNVQEQINAQLGATTNGAQVGSAIDPRIVVASVIKTLLTLVGTIFLVLIVMSGYWLVTARGDESKVEKAQATIRSAIIGLLIVLLAYGITIFATTRIFAGSLNTPSGANTRGDGPTLDFENGFQSR